MRWFWSRKHPSQGLPGNLIMEGAPARFHVAAGRRFVSNVPYALPKDSGEIQRLDFQHFLLKYGLQANFLAPINQPMSIVDVGCGTGRWAMELAQQFPKARVVGVDLVPTEKFTSGYGLVKQPDNYQFVKGNVLEGLPFPDGSFTFVHQRLLVAAIPQERWPFVIRELVRVTRVGGWVELAECGVPQDDPNNPYPQLWDTWIAFCRTRGIDFTIGNTIGTMLKQAGLQEVQQHEVLFPMGKWGGRVGLMSGEDCLAVGKALGAGVVAAGIKTRQQYDALFAATEAQFKQPTGTSVLPFYIAFGQKGGH
jgi:ubiquinone/menaquinone biosynthesis C-methylase UbiE